MLFFKKGEEEEEVHQTIFKRHHAQIIGMQQLLRTQQKLYGLIVCCLKSFNVKKTKSILDAMKESK